MGKIYISSFINLSIASLKTAYGYTSVVLDLLPSKTGKTITAMLRESESGNIVSRKMGAERLVAIG